MAQNLPIQNAYRLLHFMVTKIDMAVINESGYTQLKHGKLDLSIDSDIGINENDPKVFFINYKLSIDSLDSMVKLHLEAVTFFEAKDNVTEEDLNSVLYKVNAPAIGFPFVRSFINTLTTNAGLPSLILPTFNFAKLDKKED